MIANHANLLYPNRHQLDVLYDEGSNPHLFNYFALHGFQVFIQRTRKLFKVWTRGWLPHHFIDTYTYSNGQVDYITCNTDDIFQAMRNFANLCEELLGSYRRNFMGYNPLIPSEYLQTDELSLPANNS